MLFPLLAAWLLLAATAKPRTPQRLVGIPETQHRLGDVTRKYIYDLISSGQLPSCRVGRRRMIIESGLDAYIDERIAAEKSA